MRASQTLTNRLVDAKIAILGAKSHDDVWEHAKAIGEVQVIIAEAILELLAWKEAEALDVRD